MPVGIGDEEQEQLYRQDRLGWPVDVMPMNAGDWVIWNMSTLHSRDPNLSHKSRWALAVHCATRRRRSARARHIRILVQTTSWPANTVPKPPGRRGACTAIGKGLPGSFPGNKGTRDKRNKAQTFLQ
jgi:hypothetical protein